MKTILRRTAAVVLSAALLCGTALASNVMGPRIYTYTLDICDKTTLTREVMWSNALSDLRQENYVTYTPSPSVSPMVSFGSSVLSKQTVYSMAKDLEAKGKRVLSGINGDYFVMATGNPLGIVISDGVLRSSASYLHALGFNKDGSAVIGTPQLTMRANFGGTSMQINDINKIRDGGAFYLFTDDFGDTTQNTIDGYDVILSPVTEGIGQTAPSAANAAVSLTRSAKLGVGKLVSCKVEQVIDAEGATKIPDGKFVLSVSDKGDAWFQEMLRSLQVGDTVDIEISSADTRWNSVDSAIGAMYYIVSGGAVSSDIPASIASPRTAVGIKPDGSVIFYTIDGRQEGHSMGANIEVVAERLIELGCTEAVLLDGGGSTSLVSTYPDRTSFSAINSPSEGTPRAVTNAVFLVSNLSATNIPGSLYVTPSDLLLLPGASTQCEAACVDTGWHPMAMPGTATWSAGSGSVTAGGLYTAPAQAGVYPVTADCGDITGKTQVTVVYPDTITLKNAATGKAVSSLSLSSGDSVSLTASASYCTLPVKGGNSSFQWTATTGTITPEGTFTAGKDGTGSITVTCGTSTKTIPVTVTTPSPFADMSGHWAKDYTTELYESGIINGVSVKGKTYFQPDKPITRGDFALMAARYLGLDLSEYADVTLPYADASLIPSWDQNAIKALYEKGILQGSSDGTGRRFAYATRTITRAEAMTILGRMLPDAMSDTSDASALSAFSDAAAVPSWAKSHVAALVSQGIVNGSDGKLYPNSSITRAEVAKLLWSMKQ